MRTVSNRRKTKGRMFARLEAGYRCPGCDELARYLDTPTGRDWYMPHDATCPTLDDRDRAAAVTVEVPGV